MNNGILISDLSICEPRSALADRYAPGKWKRLPYEADGFRGVMLGALGKRPAAPLRLPLKLRGWHDIYVGLYRTYNPVQIRLRLSSDRAYRKFLASGMDLGKFLAFVDEYHWKAADLTGESIQIAPYKAAGAFADHFIAYFRLVPLSPTKARALQRDRARQDNKRLYAMNDGAHDIIYSNGLASKRQIAEEVDVYKNTDFRGIMWEFVGGVDAFFPLPGVEPFRAARTSYSHPHYERQQRTREQWEKTGFDYLRVVRDLTKSAGLELYLSQRMSISAQPPFEEMWGDDFNRGKHDDYCRHADGRLAARLSYARRAVQDRLIHIFKAAATYGIDGIHLITIRGGPMVMYEKEMLERFRERYGKSLDARKLPLYDERVWKVRAELFGEYLRRLREAVHHSAWAAGHKPPLISIHGLGTRSAMRTFGLDFRNWAQRGLVDRIVASPWGGEFGTEKYEWPDFDGKFYLDCVKGTKTELVAEVWRPRAGKNIAEHYRAWVDKWYKLGFQYLTFWDTQERHSQADQFAVLSVLGHKRDLQNQIALAGKRYRQVRLNTLLGIELAKHRFPPWLNS